MEKQLLSNGSWDGTEELRGLKSQGQREELLCEKRLLLDPTSGGWVTEREEWQRRSHDMLDLKHGEEKGHVSPVRAGAANGEPLRVRC
jgi:hypothetical protein